MTTGVIYARVSSIGDRQSTERQVKDLSEYAKYKGIEVRKVFEEHISGAKKNDERPVLCEAMEYCKANRIGILLVSELSRLGRNAFEVLASVKELIDSGINLYIQKEQLTLLDEEGHPSLFAPIMIATLSTCAQLERDNISIDVETFRLSHDRFLCIDDDVYHIGASIKDLGKKWFGFSKMEILTPDELVERINKG